MEITIRKRLEELFNSRKPAQEILNSLLDEFQDKNLIKMIIMKFMRDRISSN